MKKREKQLCELCREHGSCFLLAKNKKAYRHWLDSFRMQDEEIISIIPCGDENKLSELGLIEVTKGHAELKKGYYGAAQVHYKQAAQVSSYNNPALIYTAVCLYFLGDIEEAYSYAERAFDPFVGYTNNKGNRFALHCQNVLKEKGKLHTVEKKAKIFLAVC